jgi:hypothetical protein
VIAVATSRGSERISTTSAVSTATSGARTDRDAHIRLRERGRIVDAVADHRHRATPLLQFGDLRGLVGGQHLGDDVVEWMEPKKAVWKSGKLEVGVNPELWVEVDGDPQIVKLYYKAEHLSQQKVNLALYLLEKTVGKHGTVGILDLQQEKLFKRTKDPPEGMNLLLASEAVGFVTLWDALP